MKICYIAAMVCALLGGGLAFGEAEQSQPEPTTVPQPAATAKSPTAPEANPEQPLPTTPCLVDPPAPALDSPSPEPALVSPSRTLWDWLQTTPATGLCDCLKFCFCPELDNNCARVFTVDAEFLLWFLANSHDNAVLGATNFLGTPGVGVVGTLGDAEHTNPGPTSGGRISLGYWQTQDNYWIKEGIRDFGAEATVFVVGQQSLNVSLDQSPNLVRPFFDLNNRQESGFVVAAPGFATGSIFGHAQADLWGAEANLWKNVYYTVPGTNGYLNLMGGVRYLNGNENLQISSVSVFNPSLPVSSPYFSFAGNQLNVSDSFSTRNQFYGGQVGVDGKCWLIDKLCLELCFKLALGVTAEDLTIVGSQLRTFANGTTMSYIGGLLALPSNIGEYHLNKFGQVPEIDFKLSCPLTCHLNLSTGFSALYWNSIARPGEQIDRVIDITQIPNFPPAAGATPTGLAHPAVSFNQSDLWALSFSIGLEVKW